MNSFKNTSFNFLFLLFVSLNAVQDLNIEVLPEKPVESTLVQGGSSENTEVISSEIENGEGGDNNQEPSKERRFSFKDIFAGLSAAFLSYVGLQKYQRVTQNEQELHIDAQPDMPVESKLVQAGYEEGYPIINNNTQNESAIVSDISPSSDNPKEISDSSDEILLSEENSGGVDAPQGLNSEPEGPSEDIVVPNVPGGASSIANRDNHLVRSSSSGGEELDREANVNRFNQPDLLDVFVAKFNIRWKRAANWEASDLAEAVDDLINELGNATYLSKEHKNEKVLQYLWIIWDHPKFRGDCDTLITKPDREQILKDHSAIKNSLDKLLQVAMEGDFLPKFNIPSDLSYYIISKDSDLRKKITTLVSNDKDDKFSEDILAFLYAHCGNWRHKLTVNETPGSILREFRLACLDEDDFSHYIKVIIDKGLISAALIANVSRREYHITLGKIEDVAKIKKSDLKKFVKSLISRLNEPFFECIDKVKVDFSSKNVECLLYFNSTFSKLGCSLDVFFQILHCVTSFELCDDDKVKINFKDGVADELKEQLNSILFNKNLKYLAACRYLNILSFFNISDY